MVTNKPNESTINTFQYAFTSDEVLRNDNVSHNQIDTMTVKETSNKFSGINSDNHLKSGVIGTNLTAYQPVDWDDVIVLSTITGTNTSASTINDDQIIYLDWAEINNGTTNITQTFYTKLYVDGTLQATYNTTGLSSNYYASISDAPIGPLSAGSHTFKIVVDANGNVPEIDESDNEYIRSKTITVTVCTNLTPYKPSNWDEKIVLSTVKGTITSAATINDNQIIYLDWAAINNGTCDITQTFYTKLYVDGTLQETYNTTGLTTNSYTYFNDVPIGPLSAGVHTFKVVVDANGNIAESNESDNEFTLTKTIQQQGNPDINVTPSSITIHQTLSSAFIKNPSYSFVDNSIINPIKSKDKNEIIYHSMGSIVPDSIVKYWKNHKSSVFYQSSLSPSIDWSNNDSPVKDQKGCGSCWAFAATAYIENLGTQSDLSEQVVLSCSNAGNCSGGQFRDALLYFQSTGVPPESCYPYTETNGSCSNKCTTATFKEKITTVSNTLWGLTTVNNLKAQLQNGPLVVRMLVPTDNTFDGYPGYQGGIYNYNGLAISSETRGHAVLLVGYDDNQQCFKVKNSWGSGWGENGYFRIAYDDVTDYVQFGSYAINGSGVFTQNLLDSSFEIANQGNGNLEVSSILDNKDWLTTSGFPEMPFSLSPSGSQNVSIAINWSLVGYSTQTGIITIASNDPDEPVVNIQVTAVPLSCNVTAPNVGAITQPNCATATGGVILSGLPPTGIWTLTRTPGGITTTGSGTSSIISGLAAGTYTFTVTNASGCTSPTSANVIINAQSTTPMAPIATVATSISQTSFASNWEGVTTATGYRLDIATNVEFTTFASGYNNLDVSNVTTFNITGLNPITTYYLRVRAYSLCGVSPNSGTVTVTTLPNPPAAPTTKPGTDLLQTSFNANWNAAATATGYRLDIATNTAFTSFVTGYNDKDVGNVTTCRISGLSAITHYYMRVRGYNAGGAGASSITLPVTTLTNPPAAPVGLTAFSCNNLVTLKWRKNTDPYFIRYNIYGGLTSNPTTKIDFSTDAITDTTKVISGLVNGQTYFFAVTAVNYDGPESTFSAQSSAKVKTGLIPVVKTKWGDLLICYNLGDSISSYQWYNGSSLIPNATGQYYTTNKVVGTYKVETIDINGCKNTSNTALTSGTKSLVLYPNPASVSFSIKFKDVPTSNDGSEEKALVSIINSAGSKVMEFQAKNVNDELFNAISVSHLSNGTYIVQVLLNEKDLYYSKIVVLK